MKNLTIIGSRKRKQNTSLLKIKGKKVRVQQKSTSYSVQQQIQQTNKVQKRYNENQLYLDLQCVNAKYCDEKLISRQQHNYVLQNKNVLKLNANKNQSITNHCECLFCKKKSFENVQRNQKNQMAYQHKIFQKQQVRRYEPQQIPEIGVSVKQFKPEVIHCNPIKRLTIMKNFQTVLRTEAIKPTAVGGKFYQQNVKYNRKFISNKQDNTDQMQTNWSTVIKEQSYTHQPTCESNTNLQGLYFENYYHQHNFVSFNQFSTVQGSNGSLTPSIKSSESDTNDVMTLENFDNFITMSEQFEMINDLDYYNFVY